MRCVSSYFTRKVLSHSFLHIQPVSGSDRHTDKFVLQGTFLWPYRDATQNSNL